MHVIGSSFERGGEEKNGGLSSYLLENILGEARIRYEVLIRPHALSQENKIERMKKKKNQAFASSQGGKCMHGRKRKSFRVELRDEI